jgi:hypothetical protein
MGGGDVYGLKEEGWQSYDDDLHVQSPRNEEVSDVPIRCFETGENIDMDEDPDDGVIAHVEQVAARAATELTEAHQGVHMHHTTELPMVKKFTNTARTYGGIFDKKKFHVQDIAST